MDFYALVKPLLHRLSPEAAHRAAIKALQAGIVPTPAPLDYPALRTTVAGLTFSNPLGLAAGFDKDAEAVEALMSQGFGFVEAGTVTPRPQQGNPKPRLFRLPEDKAVVNRMGFNSRGVHFFLEQLKRRKRMGGILGINIGRNKETANEVGDYTSLLEAVYSYADYITVNISSPNTAGLRSLQERSKLEELIGALMEKRTGLSARHSKMVPFFIKIAPDLTVKQKEGIAEAAVLRKVDGLIVSNTTIDRPEYLKGTSKKEEGGLSGAPLFELSTHVLRQMYKMTEGKIPLIGVGGICNGEDAYEKIKAGASLVQLYTALAYDGFGLVRRIVDDLHNRLKRDGFSTIMDAVGTQKI